MAIADLQKLRDQAALRQKAAIDAANREYRDALHAINKVQKMLGKNGDALPSPQETPEWPGIRGAVNKSLPAMPGDFTINDVKAFVDLNFPGSAVSRDAIGGELWRLAKEGKIEVVEKGAGRRPSTYRVKAMQQKGS